MSRPPRHCALFLLFVLMSAIPVAAQDTLQLARSEAAAGNHQAAVTRLQTHLAAAPNDLDARVLLGTVYAWMRNLPDARRELQRVLDANPNHTDALAVMANVELWDSDPRSAESYARRALDADASRADVKLTLARALRASGRLAEARDTVEDALERTPGDADAKELLNELGADRPWQVESNYAYDHFDDGSVSWQEFDVSLKRESKAGPIIGRLVGASRFSNDDRLFEVEMYPRLGGSRYGYINVGFSPDGILFPDYRLAFELYQPFGSGFETSFGYRRLGFAEAVNIYTPSLSKYLGNYLFSARVFLTPDSDGTSTTLHLSARRYFNEGLSYVGLRYIDGSVREDARDLDDVLVLDSHGVVGDLSAALTPRLTLNIAAGYSDEERVRRDNVKHVTLRTGLAVRF